MSEDNRRILLAAVTALLVASWLALTVAVFRDLSDPSVGAPSPFGLSTETSGTPLPEAAGRATPARPAATPRAGRGTVRPLLLKVTAYCYTGHRTASGVWPRPGMAAGNRWPFGTRLTVEDVGVVVVTDRIGWGSELDLYMPSCADAIRFGRRHLIVREVTR